MHRRLPHIALIVMAVAAFGAATAVAQSDSAYFRDVLYLGREYINDHAIVEADGVWHLFYTRGDMSIRPWMSPGNEIDIGHAVSNDLLTWRTLAPALRIGPRGSLDAEHIYAPSVIRDGDRWLMLYTGNARGFFSGEHILAATSNDLVTWTKLDRPPAPMPDTNWAEFYPPGYDSGGGGPVSCRDPFLLKLADGSFVCYYVTRLRVTDGSRPRACVAAATSTDLVTWTQRGAVLTRLVIGNDVNPYTHPESPCVVERNGHYYLFWKGGSATRWVMSDDPLDFQEAEEQFLATSHASKVFEWRGDWFITSCSRQINDVMHTYSDRTRGLYLAGIAWDGDRPRVTDLPATVGVADEVEETDEVEASVEAIHPNPARAGQRVRVASHRDGAATDVVALVVVDALGRRPHVRVAHAGGSVWMSTDDLAAGVYVVRAQGRSQRLVIAP